MAKPSQQSIPGTNLPALEEVAEEYYAKVTARLELQEEEAEAKAALQAQVEELIKARKLPALKDDGKPTTVYKYTGDKSDGSTTARVITCTKKTSTNVAVHNAKAEEAQQQQAAA